MALTFTKRSVGLMVAAAVTAGWMSASLTQSPPPEQSSRASSGPRPLGVAAPVPRAENLRARLSEPPKPAGGRNPFVYGARAPRRSTAFRNGADARTETPEMAPIALPAPVMPIFKLSGIASTAEGDATVLTAIMNDNGTMVFAKAGDQLSNGYSVVRVEETSVTLADASGITQTIRLP